MVSGDSGEVVAGDIADSVLRWSEGTVKIYSSIAGTFELRYQHGREKNYGGLTVFGDGASHHDSISSYLSKSPGMHGTYRNFEGGEANPVEVVCFEPVIETVFETETVQRRRSGLAGKFGRTDPATRQVPVGTRPGEVMGPEGPTAAVLFSYAFNPNLASVAYTRAHGYPEYREVDGHRGGNCLILQAVLPQSVATALAEGISREPAIAREIVEALAFDRGGVTLDHWHGKSPYNPLKPPYSDLPESHQIFRIDPETWAVGSAKGWRLPTSKEVTSPGPGQWPGVYGAEGPRGSRLRP